MEQKNNQVKLGATLSYLLIFLNAVYGVVMTPFIIKCLGVDEYGVYKTIASLSSSMMVMDIGIGGTVQRYVAKYRASQQEDKIPNFVSMSLIISVGLNVLVILVSIAMCFLVKPIYGGAFTSQQINLAIKLFALLTLNVLMIILENVLNGLITGYNRFIFANGLKLSLLIIRIGLLLLLLSHFGRATTVVFIGIIISVITGLAEIIYIKKNIKFKFRFEHWDKTILQEAGKYTALMFLTSVASQIFSNMDNIVIGAIKGPELVTIYSIGLLFFSMFQNLSGGIAGVMLPTITNALNQENGICKATNIIIKAGKAQYTLLGAALIGFACIGQDFIYVWMGAGYEDVYVITLILLLPSMFELCINVCHAVLRAQNRLGFRTGTVIGSAVLNAVLTIIFVSQWSYIGAAVATACSYIVCSLILMNVYYSLVIKLPMLKIYKSILSRVSICLAISGFGLFVFSRFVNGSWLAIVLDIVVFCVIYAITLLLFGFKYEEKKQIPFVRRFIK